MVSLLIKVTLALWRPKSPVIRLFVDQLIQASKNQASALLGLCEGNSPVTGGFPLQKIGDAKIISLPGRHHASFLPCFIGAGYSLSLPLSFRVTELAFREILVAKPWKTYHQTSNISDTLVGYKIVDHSDVVGASPVVAAPTTSVFST